MKSRIRTTMAVLGLGLAAAFAAQASQRLFVNGATASTDVRLIGGRPYVPLSDVAKALDYTVQKAVGGYQLIKAGGATQIANQNVGKIGEEIFTGKWRFTVAGVQRVSEAMPEYLPSEVWTRKVASPGMDIVVIKCRLKNGTSAKDTIVLDKWKGNNTTLLDDDENAFEPTQHGYDAKFNEHFPNGATFLPGGAINMNLRFEVPKKAKLKDLVFTVLRYTARNETDSKVPTDIRVHLSN